MTAAAHIALASIRPARWIRAIGVAGARPTTARGLWRGRVVAGLKEIAPYAGIELILPGGSLMVLLLWLIRRYRARRQACRLTRGPWRSWR